MLEYVIRPTLKHLDLGGKDAENLLLGTAAQESALGTYIHQVNGPAVGIYQMEPATYVDIWNNFLANRIESLVRKLDMYIRLANFDGPEQMIGNLYYATAMARIHYLRVEEPLPNSDDVMATAIYYKKYYNTPLGRATVDDFIANYYRQIV